MVLQNLRRGALLEGFIPTQQVAVIRARLYPEKFAHEQASKQGAICRRNLVAHYKLAVGERLVEQGRSPVILDVDQRFASVAGFVEFDLRRPRWLGAGDRPSAPGPG